MTDQNNSAGAPAAVSPQSSALHACVRAAWQYGHRDRSELTDAERYERADYYARNALRVWGLTNVQEDDLTGPTAWRHRLPEGRQFLGGRTTQVLESLQQALDFKDRFGGELQPLFELEECYTNGGRDRGGETDLRHRRTRMDTSSDRGGEAGARQAQEDADEIAAIWDAATANAAMYVESHCVDGETHANAIMTMKRPKITPAPTDKEALRKAALAEAQDLLTPLAKEHFNRADLPEEFLNGLAYGVAAYSAAIKKLQEKSKVAGDAGASWNAESPQEEEEDPGVIRQQASAWHKVYWTLAEVSPGFHREGATGADSAVLAIRRLAAATAGKSRTYEGSDHG